VEKKSNSSRLSVNQTVPPRVSHGSPTNAGVFSVLGRSEVSGVVVSSSTVLRLASKRARTVSTPPFGLHARYSRTKGSMLPGDSASTASARANATSDASTSTRP